MMPGRHTVRASKAGLSPDESLDAIAGQRMYVTLALPEGSRMAPVAGAGAVAGGAAASPATAPAPATGAIRLPSGSARVTYMRCPAMASSDSSGLRPALLALTVCRPGIIYTAYGRRS